MIGRITRSTPAPGMRPALRNCWPQNHTGCPRPFGVFMTQGLRSSGLFSRSHSIYSGPPCRTSCTRPFFIGSSMKRRRSLGIRYHRQLEERHFTLPVFFRTDEVTPGRIIEIQCPGSAWGELQLTFEHAARLGYCADDVSPADGFATQLTNFLKAPPVVEHMLDNSSAPPGMRYFIEKTRPRLRYLGIDRGVRAADCNFIRSHAFFSICADKDFLPRLARVGRGVTYDLPPHILFDNKALLVLPFWSITRPLLPGRYSGPVSLYDPFAAFRDRTSGRHVRDPGRVFPLSAIPAVILFEVCRGKPGAELGQQGRLPAEQLGQPRLSRLSPAVSQWL